MKIRSTKGAAVLAAAVVLLIVAGVSGWIEWLFGDGTVPEFIRNVVLLFIGVPFAIWGGLALNHVWEERQTREKRRHLLQALKETFEDNRDYIDAGVAEMQRDLSVLPQSPLHLVTLDASATTRYELIDDQQLLNAIDAAHYALQHVQHRLDLLHAKYQFIGHSTNRQALEQLCDDLSRFRETQGLRAVIQQRLNRHAAGHGHGCRSYDVFCCRWKGDLIQLAVGLSDCDPDEDPARPHLGGGAYGRCEAAIAAIDAALAQ